MEIPGKLGLPTSGKVGTLRERLKSSVSRQKQAQEKMWQIRQQVATRRKGLVRQELEF